MPRSSPSNKILAAFVLAFASSAAYADVQTFGIRGSMGRAGTNGSFQPNAGWFEALATGQQISIHAEGSEAEPPTPGYQGGDALDCIQPQSVASDLRGADGGVGGVGGSAGRQGTGGDVLVIYTARSDLREVAIFNNGGSYQFPAFGGPGGAPCRCSVRQWIVDGQSFRCEDGRSDSGPLGDLGYPYAMSNVYVAQQDMGFLSPFARRSLQQAVGAPVMLGINRWRRRSDGQEVFSPRSRFVTDYFEFEAEEGRLGLSFVWAVARPLSDLAGVDVMVDAQNGSPKITLPRNISYSGHLESVGAFEARYVFDRMYYWPELTELRELELVGAGVELRATFHDYQHLGSNVRTRISKIRFSSGRYGNIAWVADVRVPPEFVHQEGDAFSIDLGRLGIDPRHLQVGRDVLVEIIGERGATLNPAPIFLRIQRRL